MLRSTCIILAAVAIALPAAAQAVTTVPLELFKLDTATEQPLPPSPQYQIALGSIIRFEVVAPANGDLIAFVALLDTEGNPGLNTVIPLWSAVLLAEDSASLEIPIPLGFPEIEVAVQAAFLEGSAVTYASAVHRFQMTGLID